MQKLWNELNKRKEYLEETINKKNKKVGNKKPELRVYTNKHGNGFQYYSIGPAGRKYIKSSELKMVKQSLQLEYDIKVLEAAKEEYKSIKKCLKAHDKHIAEEIYESLPEGKRKLVIPDIIPDDEYIREWNNVVYDKLEFREDVPEIYSSKGIRVRSKSEVIIADLLDKYGINYKYEKPLKLKTIGIVHPDFTILNVKERKEIYWEHLGMLDNQDYINNAIRKLRDYENSGYYQGDRLILTGETLGCPFDTRYAEKRIKLLLNDLI